MHYQLNRVAFNKVQRWSEFLVTSIYEIAHISGEENVWAYLLSRWGAQAQERISQL